MQRLITIVLLLTELMFLGMSGLAQTPEAVEVVSPGYPTRPNGTRDQGEVKVEIKIDSLGAVILAKAVSGPESLYFVAEKAAQKWRFRASNNSVESWEIVFAFILQKGIGDPPLVSSIFKAPNRVEIFSEYRETVTISDPPVEDVGKKRRKKNP